MTRRIPLLLAPAWFLLAACGPSEASRTATAAQIALDAAATQTAAVPTMTPTATSSPTPAYTPTSTDTPTPAPEARVAVSVLDGFTEPAYDAEFVHRFEAGEGLCVTGRDRECSWLQVQAPFGELAWVNTQLGRVTLLVTCDELPHGTYQPKSGAVILDRRAGSGYGEVHVENGLAVDGYVLLTDPRWEPMYSVYIRAGETSALLGIPNGDFEVFFSTGTDWDAVDHRFAADATYSRFADPMHFESSFASRSVWRITLHAVAGGTAAVQTVPPDQFPGSGE